MNIANDKLQHEWKKLAFHDHVLFIVLLMRAETALTFRSFGVPKAETPKGETTAFTKRPAVLRVNDGISVLPPSSNTTWQIIL